MGYYTNYQLTTTPCSDELHDELAAWAKRQAAENHAFNEALRIEAQEAGKRLDYNQLRTDFWCLDALLDGKDSYMKWYDWKIEVGEMAKAFPDVTFALSGEGEEAGDLWVAYFKGDLVAVQHPEIVWPETPEWVQ